MSDTTEDLVVAMAPGVQLVVRKDKYGVTFNTWLGKYPRGAKLTFTCFDAHSIPRQRIRIGAPEDGAPDLWCGSTCFELPWLELLKVADFLRLDIPLPHPLGEQVPA